MEIRNREFSSYKDPDACVIYENGSVRRIINKNYLETFKSFLDSGLYDELVSSGLLVSHRILEEKDDCMIIEPERLFITYPWEWSFGALKDVAIATLKIQLFALESGFTLKDANCFNIQFKDGKPLLIDSSSFEKYEENAPWCAYRQFCENFLAPLALCAYKDSRLMKLLLDFPAGIPLDFAAKLLPFSKRFNFNLLIHIFLHSKMQKKYNGKKSAKLPSDFKIPKQNLQNLIKNLLKTVENINLKKEDTQWADYYSGTNYEISAFEFKKETVRKFKNLVKPDFVVDFGANSGEFSRIFSDDKIKTLSLDIDFTAVQKNYEKMKEESEKYILPLVFDISNPSPAVGFLNSERTTLESRIKAFNNSEETTTLSLALALIHHLRFTYNIPFFLAARYFSSVSKFLVIEFIEKDDSKIQKMLQNRKDIFSDYSEESFEAEFKKYFRILSKEKIVSSKRTLYLMERSV